MFALQVVPIQVTLVPLLTQYTQWGLQNTLWTLWLSHTIFGLPLAIYLLHNFMKEIPRSLIEAARVDGAGHVRVFFQVCCLCWCRRSRRLRSSSSCGSGTTCWWR